jgi:hypothetical protein
MDFEVVLLLKGKELARYQFPVETPSDLPAGFVSAVERLRVAHPEVDLLGDGILLQIKKVGR